MAARAADPEDWKVAAGLAKELRGAHSRISESDRRRFLDLFEKFDAERARLASQEKGLIDRIRADQAELKAHAQAKSEYGKHRQAWRDRLAAHNAACDRTFRDPVEVARCDRAAGELTQEGSALDAREAELSRRAARLSERQSHNVSRVAGLERENDAWARAVDREFIEPLRELLAGGRETLRLTVKSFIKVIDLSSMSAESRPRAERAFAWFTNQHFSEDPAGPSPNAEDFRLWSQVTVIVGCRGNAITSWNTSQLAHRGGKELKMLDAATSVMAPLAVVPAAQGSGERTTISLSYAIKGKPNDSTLFSFRAVRPRACENIWHRVRATVTCRNGKAALDPVINGSRFPSHRIWTNEQARSTLDQGPFTALWECDPSVRDLVR
jgi:hypothetical protein